MHTVLQKKNTKICLIVGDAQRLKWKTKWHFKIIKEEDKRYLFYKHDVYFLNRFERKSAFKS